jgi:peptide-methionine (S)-S-oxide reductase
MSNPPNLVEKATFGAGCFWCVEAVFQQLRGVQQVVSGYTGGKKANPTYKEICTGTTDHAEVAQITFNPQEISFETLLDIFWKTHDPTTLNRQGADTGTQYRSAIFYENETQKKMAEQSKQKMEASRFWPDPIVTEISPLQTFYPAESYHQNYFQENPGNPYCQQVLVPKLQKLKKMFSNKLK